MSIEVKCPNGHCMRVKSEFAGRSGLCPECHARIDVPRLAVPKSSGLSEDDLLAVLGPPHRAPRQVESPFAEAEKPQPHASQADRSSANAVKDAAVPIATAFVHRRRVCPKCCEIAPFAATECPRCQTSLSGWSFPVPADASGKEGRRPMCHYLGLRKQGEVMIVRFGEHHILDEGCVKKFADELFQVTEREDCRNVLLNFTGVVGLSSAMLGVMLMLRKRISQKQGKLKLCLVGPQIMDIFHATKLGQIFEILGNEQQGLKAFG
jgi:anti-anti-sigma factor